MLYSIAAFPWNYGGAKAKNRLGQTIYFSEGAGSTPEGGMPYVIEVSTPGRGDDDYEKFQMESECPTMIKWLDITSPQRNERPIIHCRADGKSPIAGATYTKIRSKKIKNSCGDPATVFKCIRGCKEKAVPLLIIESPWEC